MNRLSRRDFLRVSVAAAGSAAAAKLLAACGQEPTAAPRPTGTAAPSPTSVAAATSSSAQTAPPPTQTALPGRPDLVVTRGGEPEQLVRAAVESLGGMARFVRPGANVVIKPNICVAYHTYEYAATTNPWVVAALVKLCLEAGAGSVKVLDAPFGGTQQEAYRISGIQEQVEAAGGTMAKMPAFKYATARIADATRLNLVNIFEDVLTTDTVVINVPIAKTHGLARLTLGMKNLMGLVLDRPELHQHLSENLADLASLVRPALTVVDAVRILIANGPTGGSLDDVRKLDTVVASTDLIAADSYAATLFGLRPDDLGYVVAGAAKGLGRSDLQNLRIQEIQLGAS